MFEFYGGTDILDYHRGEITPRRMGLFIDGLVKKEGSELYREIGGDVALWSIDRHLLASIVNELRIANYQFTCANSERPDSVPKPVMIERPGTESAAANAFTQEMESVPVSSLSDITAFSTDLGAVPNADTIARAQVQQ